MTTASLLNVEQPSLVAAKKQRFLIVSSLFPPDVLGGAEISAYNFACWLRDQGHEVGVLTTAKIPSEAHEARMENGLMIWRVQMPRAYPLFNYATAKLWAKPIWHLQDHFDPRNRKIVAKVLREFKPDHINIHVLQGIGYNTLTEFAKSGAPVTYVMHDLSLACFRMAMFVNNHSCEKKCTLCALSSNCKVHWLKKIPKLKFILPSRANLLKVAKHFPLKLWPAAALVNPNQYPPPTVQRVESPTLRLLYVGRIQPNKGVSLLLEAASNLARHYSFTLTLIGAGPQKEELQRQYGQESWCQFKGFLSEQMISDEMINSDVLCTPSIWSENSPGVIIHALGIGLPVIGSNQGGIPELVEDQKNGMLVQSGDLGEWQAALEKILKSPSLLSPWRQYALSNAYKFEQNTLGNKVLNFIQESQE